MALVLHILGVTFPFFGLVLCGYSVTRSRLMPIEAIPGLNIYVLYLALPCMLFSFAAQTPIARLMDIGTVSTYVFCAVLMLLLTLTTDGLRARGWNDTSFGALVAAFPNSGFLGVPLLVEMLGQRAAAPAIVALSIDMVLTTSICIGLSRWGGIQGKGALATGLSALRGMILNPLPWAIFLGSLASGMGTVLPPPLNTVVHMLAQSASPVALVTLGAVLARPYLLPKIVAVSKQNRAGDFTGVSRLAAYKLLLHPLLVVLVAQVLVAIGVPLDSTNRMVLVLIAALPSASNVPILAERFGADAGRIASIVMLSTVAAFVTFSLVAVGVAYQGELSDAPKGQQKEPATRG